MSRKGNKLCKIASESTRPALAGHNDPGTIEWASPDALVQDPKDARLVRKSDEERAIVLIVAEK